MSWRDELRPASFRGVPFEVISVSGDEGRRYVADEAPESDELAPPLDLGRRRPEFRVRGFVIGDDYLDQRKRLLAALNAAGPGELVHPYRGRVRVQVGGVSWQLGPGHGVCQIEWDCVDAGGKPLEVVKPIAATRATDSASAASAVVLSVYTQAPLLEKFFEGAVLPDFTRYVKIPGVDNIAAYLDADTWSADVAAGFAELLQQVDDWRALLRYARSAASYVWHSVGAALDALHEQQIRENNDGSRLLAAVRAAEIVSTATYAYADLAEQTMVEVAAELDTWAASASGDLFVALIDLRVSVIDTLTDAAERLPRKTTITLGVPTPALVVAYDRFGADSFDELEENTREIIQLNGGNPAFLAGDIEVLSS